VTSVAGIGARIPQRGSRWSVVVVFVPSGSVRTRVPSALIRTSVVAPLGRMIARRRSPSASDSETYCVTRPSPLVTFTVVDDGVSIRSSVCTAPFGEVSLTSRPTASYSNVPAGRPGRLNEDSSPAAPYPSVVVWCAGFSTAASRP
jgi:hypothetical protein